VIQQFGRPRRTLNADRLAGGLFDGPGWPMIWT
jgi:hypothetical protein